jgi:membrane associated rhomboid family serine protease
MLIIGDTSHHRGRVPWVTGALVVINLAMYLVQVALGEPFTNGFSLVPREITELRDLTKKERVKVKVHDVYVDHYGNQHTEKREEVFYVNHYPGPFPIVLTLFTSMFLHGNLIHLIGNMWFLLIFGRNVECALDHGRFLAFFVLCGVVGGLAHVASDPKSVIPCMGASGAISGVLGAYVAIHPLNKIKCWFGWWLGVVELPALVVIGIWFLLQYLSAFLTWEHPELGDGVAYWDHLGGFVAGMAFIWGTIAYLKRQQANGGIAEIEAAVPMAAAALGPDPTSDPFASFLPESNVRTEPPKPTAPPAAAPVAVSPDRTSDPFASFLPEHGVRAEPPRPKPAPARAAYDPFASFVPGDD